MPTACEIHFLDARNLKPADIYLRACEVYEEHVMGESMRRRWVRNVNNGHENVIHRPVDRLWLTKNDSRAGRKSS